MRKCLDGFFDAAVGALALIGLPPFAGAWSKYYLVLGTLDEGSYALLAVLLLLQKKKTNLTLY